MVSCYLIETEEILDRQREGRKKGDETVYIEPGMMWLMPWVWDHQDPDLEQYRQDLIRRGDDRIGYPSVSRNYLEDWALIRDPVAVMLPTSNHMICYPDSNSLRHRSWRVSGQIPRITLDRPIIVSAVQMTIIDGRIERVRDSAG